MAQLVENLPAMWKMWVQSLGWEDPLEKGKANKMCGLCDKEFGGKVMREPLNFFRL